MTHDISLRHTLHPVVVGGRAEEDGTARDEIVYELLDFSIGEERYALPLRSVREILKPPPLTEVPRAPDHVLGIVSVRGRVVTVVDLRRRLHMEPVPFTKQTRILLVDDGEEVVGVLVDSVQHVVRLTDEEVELATSLGGDTADYVIGIGRPSGRAHGRGSRADAESLRDEILILLDPQALLRRGS